MPRLALLFDLDGTLVDTDILHHTAFASVLAERGRELSLEEYKARIMGHPNVEIMAHFFPGEEDRHAEIAELKESRFRDALGTSVSPTPGILELLDWAEREGAGTAVVTNAPRGNATAMLAAAGLSDRLPVLVIGDECARAKPDPLPYRMAMDLVGATPASSVAFEDSPSGLRAARAAGAHVFGLPTGLPAGTLRSAGAHEIIADFTAPTLWSYLTGLRARTA